MTAFVIFHSMNRYFPMALIIDHVNSGLQIRNTEGTKWKSDPLRFPNEYTTSAFM